LKWGLLLAGVTLLSENDNASLLSMGPVYIDPWRKGSLANQGMVRRGIDVAVHPATTVAGKAVRRDSEKQVNVIRLVVACNCSKANLAFLPRLKSRVSSEEFL
jgi:hypothetical protein